MNRAQGKKAKALKEPELAHDESLRVYTEETERIYSAAEVKAVSDAADRVEGWFEAWRAKLALATEYDQAILEYMLLNLYAVQETKDAVWTILDAVAYRRSIVH